MIVTSHVLLRHARDNFCRVWFFIRPFRGNDDRDAQNWFGRIERRYVNNVLQFAIRRESHSLCTASRANVFLAKSILLLPIRDERRPAKQMSLRRLVAAVTRIFHRQSLMSFLRALRERKRLSSPSTIVKFRKRFLSIV